MYSLEYGTMTQVLRQLGFSGEFHAKVSSQPALREGGEVVLLVQNGNVISCFIFNKKGQKLYHDVEAQRLLPKLGILDWQLTSSSFSPTANSVPPPAALPVNPTPSQKIGPIPQRRSVPEAQMRTWSMLERSVYSLVDGKHSIEQIATLLSRPISTIEQIIHKFEVSGVIVRS